MAVENASYDQDLMVSLNIVSAKELASKDQNQRDFLVSYWKEIIPKDNSGIVSTRPWMLIHTAPHMPPLFEQRHHMRMRVTTPFEREEISSKDGGSFCGWDTPLSFIQLDLSDTYLRRVAAELGLSGIKQSQSLQVSHTRDPKILQVSKWLLEELLGGRRVGNLYVDSLGNLLTLQILLHANSSVDKLPYHQLSQPVPKDVAHAIEYMRAHLSEDISLADLSRYIHLSPSQLGRLFKRDTSLAPHQYLILLRVAHARELLHSGKLSISEVASRSGFVDQSHLNRHFKRIFGTTPKAILNGR